MRVIDQMYNDQACTTLQLCILAMG